ncbi:hypothetical protein LTR70_010531 [Exophiala xenobiotica]|uniref:DUF1857-domain-containing protein n=1 Tax=Lithohypha guttulata TaxID=1690604 RepID=A0ABR0JU38_9EURO|nr:hypothetical protein LTR24_010508 [Lithohypha guttulata]KAK5309185.1 hypothetical protein LTR70_010531 [Exophiala xenobiotica]
MSATPAAYIAFSAPINPSGASPVLTKAQIYACLHRKVRHAEEFVAGAIKATDVLSESTDEHGREVVTREVVFAEGDRRVKEVCTSFGGVKTEFIQPDRSKILNIVSDSADGQLYLTYQFEWLMPKDTPEETQKENTEKWTKMSKMAVEGSIKAMREMVSDGRIKA